ncbi:MAG: response regulator transcription factor [Clostridiaceae bacterium]|nr:response regulator transcription factor [Clostridiaceae bacterium]
MVRILLVEDDKSIVNNLTEYLRGEGFEVDSVSGQAQAVNNIENKKYDLLLVDISLKEGNGFAVCAAARSISQTPVIFLTASADEYSIITGLDMGADDYVSKPFRPRELLSRIKSVLRRSNKHNIIIEQSNIKVDTAKGIVLKDGEEIFLSALEYRLLLVFFNNKGVVMSRNKLLEEIYDIAGEFVNDNTLTVYIKRLRDKIEEDPQNPTFIKTVRGLGYKVGD